MSHDYAVFEVLENGKKEEVCICYDLETAEDHAKFLHDDDGKNYVADKRVIPKLFFSEKELKELNNSPLCQEEGGWF